MDSPGEFTSFAGAAATLYSVGALEGADVYVFCMECEDVTEAWELSPDTCAQCGFVVPEELPCDMHGRSN